MSGQGTLFGPTLAEARQQVEEGKTDGIDCPCCGQYCRSYRRKLNSNMARFLCNLVSAYSGDCIHHSHLRSSGEARDYPYLARWGLMTDEPSDTSDRRRSGYWRPTAKGIAFAHGEITVPSRVFLWDNEVEGFSDEHTTIQESLGKDFDYREMMSGAAERPGTETHGD